MASLTLLIERNIGMDTKIKCNIDGILIWSFYSFAEGYTNSQIDSHIRNDLTNKGYIVN